MNGTAIFSDCRRYRYWLTREISAKGVTVAFVMLNPSTADAEVDDPTIRRCMGFARAWGYGGIVVANLCPLRATNPKELPYSDGSMVDALVRNIEVVEHLMEGCFRSGDGYRDVFAAWGANRAVRWYAPAVRPLHGKHLRCIDLTKGGFPKHPLYVKADTKPMDFQCTRDGSIWASDGGRRA